MPWNQVMHKWKAGTLKSGSDKGPPVKSRQQAIAIMLSEKRKAGSNKEYSAGPTPDAKRKIFKRGMR